MMQGNHCDLGIRIFNNAGSAVIDQDVIDVEITIGHLRKTYRNGQLRCTDGIWMFPLTQQESFAFPSGAPRAQVRVLWANGVIEGCPLRGVTIQESISKEVL